MTGTNDRYPFPTRSEVVDMIGGAPGGGGVVFSVAGRTGDVTLTKTDVGLGNVSNTPDADKPVSTAQATALVGKSDALKYPWLGACFRGNSLHTQIERLWLASSSDGLDWKLTPTSYTPASGTVRDPDLYWDGTTLWIAHTTIAFNAGNSFAIAKWDGTVDANNVPVITPTATVTVTGATSVCWAPQWIIDGGAVKIAVTIDGPKTAIITAQNAQMTSWSAPTLVDGITEIDFAAVKVGSTWQAFASGSGSQVNRYTGANLAGPYTSAQNDPAGAGQQVEAPVILLLPDGVTYRLYMDHHQLATTIYSETTDFSTWTTPRAITTSIPNPRHFGFLRDTSAAALGSKIATASSTHSGANAARLLPTAIPLSTMSTNGPGVGATRGVKHVPDRDIIVGAASFEMTTAGTANDAYEIVLFDSNFTRIATTGTGVKSGAPTNSLGVKTAAFTAPARLRKGNAYFLVFAFGPSKSGGPELRCLSLGAGYHAIQQQTGRNENHIIYTGTTVYNSPASITSPEIRFQADGLGFLLTLVET